MSGRSYRRGESHSGRLRPSGWTDWWVSPVGTAPEATPALEAGADPGMRSGGAPTPSCGPSHPATSCGELTRCWSRGRRHVGCDECGAEKHPRQPHATSSTPETPTVPPNSCATTRMKTFCSPHAHEGIAEETQMAPAPEDPGRAPPSSAMQSTIAQRTHAARHGYGGLAVVPRYRAQAVRTESSWGRAPGS